MRRVAAPASGTSVWITVNSQAIRECTGPNGKPTVAQFCAFAVLADGRRVQTISSQKVEYCNELFRRWTGGTHRLISQPHRSSVTLSAARRRPSSSMAPFAALRVTRDTH